MGYTLRASQSGLQIVGAARRRLGWNKKAEIWCAKAFVCDTTLGRFWQGRSIQKENFINICRAVNINNYEIVASDNFLHIERSVVEGLACRSILAPGALLRIKGSKKMGKTELLNRLESYPEFSSYHKPRLAFRKMCRDTFSDSSMFLQWFCRTISEQIDIDPTQVDNSWNTVLGSNDHCDAYFRRIILPTVESPIILFLDDVDKILPHGRTASEFFKLLRGWYEDAKRLSAWQNLRFIMAYSTDAYINLDINHSPFNVGTCIDLPEFTYDEILELGRRYDLPLHASQAEQLITLLGGHPYLVNKAFDTLRSSQQSLEVSLTKFLAIAHTAEAPYSNYLRSLEDSLKKHPRSVELFKKVLASTRTVTIDRDQAFKLHSLGLLRWHGNQVEPRCQIYRLYFQERLR